MAADWIRCEACGLEFRPESPGTPFEGTCPECLGLAALNNRPISERRTATVQLEPTEAAVTGPLPIPKSGEFGRFLLTERLGRGGMGEVWKAFDKELKRWVALKFLREECPRDLARFRREARMAASLAHPGIAAVYEVGESQGRHWIAMQYVQGRTLQSFPLDDRRQIVRLMRDAALAVDHAHRHGIIHRDLKPGNVMVHSDGADWRAIVLDFGLARSIEGGPTLSQTGSVAGTPAYMSPEQARGAEVDARADVYSLGATLYELLTGVPPFDGSGVLEILRKAEVDAPVSPRKINKHIPHDLETVVLQCLEKDPALRYGSARELAEDLTRFLEGEAVHARRPGPIHLLRVRLVKRKGLVATVALALVAAVFVGRWLLAGTRDTEHSALMAEATREYAEANGAAAVGGHPPGIAQKARAAREAFERAIAVVDAAPAQVMRARCFLLEGRLAYAIEALERAHELDPADVEARLQLAKALLVAHRAPRGVASIARGACAPRKAHACPLRFDPGDPSGAVARVEHLLAGVQGTALQMRLHGGLLAMVRGDYALAAEELASYTRSERGSAGAMLLEGIARVCTGDRTQAIVALDGALDRVPSADAYFWRGLAKAQEGVSEEATRDFTRALDLNPAHVYALNSLGVEKSRRGLHRDALQLFARVTQVDRKLTCGHLNLGIAKAALRRHEDAIAHFDAAFELDPKNALVLLHRGAAQVAAGRLEDGIADFRRVLERDAGNVTALCGLGVAKGRKGLSAEALAHFADAIRIDPQHADAWSKRAAERAAGGDFEGAIKDATMAIGIDAGHAGAWTNRGRAKASAGLADAEADFEKALQIDENHVDAHLHLGMFLSARGRHEEALKRFDRALTLDGTNPLSKYGRGVARARLGRDEEAIEDHAEVVDRWPKSPVASKAAYEIAVAHARQGRRGDALAWLERSVELGWRDAEHLERDGDLASLRGDERYAKLVERLKVGH